MRWQAPDRPPRLQRMGNTSGPTVPGIVTVWADGCMADGICARRRRGGAARMASPRSAGDRRWRGGRFRSDQQPAAGPDGPALQLHRAVDV